MNNNFIIFFDTHEGSSIISSQLGQLSSIDTIEFEPFDIVQLKNNMKDKYIGQDLITSFDILLNKNLKDNYIDKFHDLHKKYYRDQEKIIFDKKKSIGFKFRERNIDDIIPVLRNNDVKCFILRRRNILRWCISMYDSDNDIYSQFKTNNVVKKKYDLNILKTKKKIYNSFLKNKDNLKKKLENNNINVYNIYYEDFVEDKKNFFKNFLNKINVFYTEEEFTKLKNEKYKKVHPNDISKFVENYEEVYNLFNKQHI